MKHKNHKAKRVCFACQKHFVGGRYNATFRTEDGALLQQVFFCSPHCNIRFNYLLAVAEECQRGKQTPPPPSLSQRLADYKNKKHNTGQKNNVR